MINKLYAIRDVLISKRYYIIGFIALIFIGTIIWLSLNCEDSTQDFDIQKNTEEEVINKCSIDIKGYVLNPNFYEIECDSRVNDQTTPNMIQRISGIFERNPLISKEI